MKVRQTHLHAQCCKSSSTRCLETAVTPVVSLGLNMCNSHLQAERAYAQLLESPSIDAHRWDRELESRPVASSRTVLLRDHLGGSTRIEVFSPRCCQAENRLVQFSWTHNGSGSDPSQAKQQRNFQIRACVQCDIDRLCRCRPVVLDGGRRFCNLLHLQPCQSWISCKCASVTEPP